MLDKNLAPNLVAAAIAALGLVLPAPAGPVVLSVGLFALSGALTNWLAVHMLFERVPGLYGSGVITLRFDDFKLGILALVREELFGADKIERLFEASADAIVPAPVAAGGAADPGAAGEPPAGRAGTDETPPDAGAGLGLELGSLIEGIDLAAAFDQLVATVRESSFGSMLQMVGGESALEPLREPFERRLRTFLGNAAQSPRVQEALRRQLSSEANRTRFRTRLEAMLTARLNELTPEMVRDLMQRLIRDHLGWLVVWGGVFGGVIGLVAGLFALL